MSNLEYIYISHVTNEIFWLNLIDRGCRSVGNNDLNNNMSHDVGENFLDALSSKSLSNTAMYAPACDYLKKLDNVNSNWEFTNSSSATDAMHASNLNNFERQININGSFSSDNLPNLVGTWSIAPPEPQVVNSPFFNLPQVSCHGAHDNLQGNNNIEYQIGLNNAMTADNNYYGSGNGLMIPDSYASSNSARNFADVISFNSRLGKPLMDHVYHAPKPSNFKSLINLSDTTKKQGLTSQVST